MPFTCNIINRELVYWMFMEQIEKGEFMFKTNLKHCCRKKIAGFLAVFFISSTIATSALGSISHAASKGIASTGTKQYSNSILKTKRSTQKTDTVTLSHKKDTILVDAVNTLSLDNISKKWTANFESSDESILKITKSNFSSCEYRGVRPGTAEITVKISKPGFLFVPNNVYLHCDVTVSPRAVSIRFTKTKYKIHLGSKKKLKLTTRPSISKEKAKFESSDEDIAEVDATGRVYAKNIGTATITAKISNGKTAKCKVIVRNKPAQDKMV